MSYEAWRISYQDSEQAARAAYNELEKLRKSPAPRTPLLRLKETASLQRPPEKRYFVFFFAASVSQLALMAPPQKIQVACSLGITRETGEFPSEKYLRSFLHLHLKNHGHNIPPEEIAITGWNEMNHIDWLNYQSDPELITIYRYTHPEWDGKLIVAGDNHREKALAELGDNDLAELGDNDPAGLEYEKDLMEKNTFDNLPEFDG